MIFVDSNVFIYAVGRSHPLKVEAQNFFLESSNQGKRLATSAEVLQELLHVYLPVARMKTLDAAIELGVPHGGWIPKGRKTENGRLPQAYRLKEIAAINYEKRTELNVVDSDGTLLVSHGKLTGGSALTRVFA